MTETAGGIQLAKQAERTPVSGIVVDAVGENKEFLGKRVYFRPFVEVMIPLGPQGEGPLVTFVHMGDVLYVEVPNDQAD